MSNWQLLLETLTESASKNHILPEVSENSVSNVVFALSQSKLIRNVLLKYIQNYNDTHRKKTLKNQKLAEKTYKECVGSLLFDNSSEKCIKAQLLAEKEIAQIGHVFKKQPVARLKQWTVPTVRDTPNFPHASKMLDLVYSDEKGRHVVCKESIKTGEVLFAEYPAAFIINLDFNTQFCHACCRALSHGIFPCAACSEVVYCSSECRDKMAAVHRYECHYLAFLQALGVAHLALRCLLTFEQEDASRYGPVLGLQYHLGNLQNDELFQYTVTAILLTHFLDKCTDFFAKTAKTRLEVTELLLIHILQLIVNAHAIVYNYAKPPEPGAYLSTVTSPRIATGIYPSSAMMNHSCDPNIINNFHGNALVVRARRDLEIGEEVFNSYGPNFLRMPRRERQEVLLQQYNFSCRCGPCSMPYDIMEIFSAYKCPNCFGPLVALFAAESIGRCRACQNKFPITLSMVESLQNSNAILDKVLSEEKVPILALIGAWNNSRKFLYHSHDTTYRLADELARQLAQAGLWKQCLSVLKSSIQVLIHRFDEASSIVVSELSKISKAAHAAATQPGVDRMLAKKFREESKLYAADVKRLCKIIYGFPQILDDINV